VLVNHALDVIKVFIFDERFGPKNSNYTLSFLEHEIQNCDEWVQRSKIYMDNAAVNKSQYMTAWLGT